MEEIPVAHIFLSEVLGTGLLLLLGCGVVANANLGGTLGKKVGANWLLISFGWGLGVYVGVYAAFLSGAHINPAVTVGLMVNGVEYAPEVPITVVTTLVYFAGQMVGAILGATLCWLAYKRHYDEESDPGAILGTFSTGPAIKDYKWNFVTEVIATFVLVFVLLNFANTPAELGPLPVALLVVAIGASLGGPTGYAINPARDLGPRIAHALLPIKGKGPSNWGYAWIPVLGPVVGAAIAGGLYRLLPYI